MLINCNSQDLDSFMKEMEEVHRTTEAQKAADLQARLARLEGDDEAPGLISEHGTSLVPPPAAAMYQPIAGAPVRPGVPPPGIRPPPGPPPGRPAPAGLAPNISSPLRPGQAPPGIRPPPGPPPAAPVRAARPPAMPRPLGVVSAKPQLTVPKTGNT